MPAEPGRPILCLVTDRRRLAAAMGTPDLPDHGACGLVEQQVEGAIRGGIDVVQIRETGLSDALLLALVRRCAMLAAGTGARIVVNDRLDVTLAAGADGVHLREDGVTIAQARAIGHPRLTVGRSVHSARAAAESRTADYLIAGSVFPTASKPAESETLGLDGLRDVVGAATPCPVWAIGGITAERIAGVVGAGARGVAAIGAFVPAARQADLAGAVHAIVAELRFAFDSPGSLS